MTDVNAEAEPNLTVYNWAWQTGPDVWNAGGLENAITITKVVQLQKMTFDIVHFCFWFAVTLVYLLNTCCKPEEATSSSTQHTCMWIYFLFVMKMLFPQDNNIFIWFRQWLGEGLGKNPVGWLPCKVGLGILVAFDSHVVGYVGALGFLSLFYIIITP